MTGQRKTPSNQNSQARLDDHSGWDGDALSKLQGAVAGLAREVEAMRRAMRQAATAGELARLAQTVAELSETTAAARPARIPPEPVPSWLTLPAAVRDAQVVLSDLTGWMADVYLRYADAARSLPECWWWHPEVVEELVWLMYAWLAAYREDEASLKAAGDWHDRLRPGVVRRIETYTQACSLENHVPGRATGAPEVPVADVRDAIAGWWASSRREPGPAPTDDQMLTAAQAARRGRTQSQAQIPTNGRTPTRRDAHASREDGASR